MIFYIKNEYFKYFILCFCIVNILITFYIYINRALIKIIDIFYIKYLDNNLIYSNDKND